MKEIHSPLNIEILLDFYLMTDRSRGLSNPESDASNEIIIDFLGLGVIEKSEKNLPASFYAITDKGRAWVRAICKTECPVLMEVYVDQQGNVIT